MFLLSSSRLQRSISSKDAKILDLKAKVEQLEQTIATAQREGVVPPSTAGASVGAAGAQGADRAPRGLHPPGLGSPSTDITNMPAQELRARYAFFLCGVIYVFLHQYS